MTYPPVDIVVPIYNARVDVELCVISVLKHATGDYRLVLVDDCSTDGELVDFLSTIARERQDKIVLLRTAVNGGFVQSANLGMRAAKGRDVLLLNSDTIVTPEFLPRLQACAYGDKLTGIVTPFTNNGTICSIPRFCEDNPLPHELILDDYARTISLCSLKLRPELVTAVGFCMFVKAELFEKIGYFDERYGRGFGEENDFSERAKDIGYKIRLCDDVFIAHTGKASFGSEGPLLEQENMKVLLERFPEFLKDVTRFCETNPLAEVRANVNRHIKGMLPDSDIPIEASSELSRAVGRSIFSRWLIKLKDRKHFRAILRYGLNEFLKESSLSEELRVEGRGLYIAANSDPYLILPETSISSAVVNALRLRIKCETSRPAFAQLYWIHEQTEPFSEAKSVQLPLTHDDSWQEVLLDIRTSSNLSGWIAGPTIVRFRLDPIDRKGTFELREFSLGQLR